MVKILLSRGSVSSYDLVTKTREFHSRTIFSASLLRDASGGGAWGGGKMSMIQRGFGVGLRFLFKDSVT